MKVILLRDVPALGRKNDVKEVSGGYARNFLLPRKLAAVASDAALHDAARQKERGERERAEEEQVYRASAEKLKNLTLSLAVKMGEKGKAFGSVNAAKIQDALHKQGIAVEKEWIALDSPIKATGERTIDIKFPHGIMGKVKVMIEAE